MKFRKIALIFSILLLLTSCSDNRTIDTKNDYSSELHDGTFRASSRYFNSSGYKPQIELIVKKGIITDVNYLELNQNGVNRPDVEGAILSWNNCDMPYNEILSQLYNNTIIYQGTKIDAVSGATQTVTNYTILQDAAIDSSKAADLSEKTLDNFSDTYTVTNEVDPLTGSQETLMVEFIEGKINEVVIREATNNAAFYAIGRAYASLADISQANKTLDDVHSTSVDLNTLDRYNELLHRVVELRGN